MRVIFQSEGGIAHFPGLSRPVTIDGDQLPEPAAAELRQLIETARLFDQPAQVGSPARGAADYRRYTITVEADGRTPHRAPDRSGRGPGHAAPRPLPAGAGESAAQIGPLRCGACRPDPSGNQTNPRSWPKSIS